MLEKSILMIRIVDFAIGDVLTSFPALYQLAHEKPLAIYFDNPQIRNLWAGPPVEILSEPTAEGKSYDITTAARFFTNSGLHMIQAWFWNLGLPVPAEIPHISLAGDVRDSADDAIDVIISPFSASGRILCDNWKTWPFDRWNIVIDALLAAGLSIAVCGVFRDGADPRSHDQRFWDDRPVRVLDSLPLIDLASNLRAARCVATIDNGISHLAHILGAPHAQFIPVGPGCPPSWIVDHSPRAAWIYEPFAALPGRNDVLQPERVLEVIFNVLSDFNKDAYISSCEDLQAAFGNSRSSEAWHHWIRFGQREGRSLGAIPRGIQRSR